MLSFCKLHFQYNYQPNSILWYTNRTQAFGKVFQETKLQVDGKKSFLFVYQNRDKRNQLTYNADLYVGDLPNGQVTLHMWVSSRSAQDVEAAKTIFSRIKFVTS